MSQILDQPLQTAASAPPLRDGRRRLTWDECLLSDLFALWVIVGLFVDGWAHNHQKPETFFTSLGLIAAART